MSGSDKQKMVGWYDPGQLLQTAGQVVVSTIFGKNSDQRMIEALFADVDPVSLPDPSDPRLIKDGIEDYSDLPELWLDYVADMGDGWNSTYSVAYHLSQPTLSCRDPKGGEYTTQRGHVLVFGGDEVYPTASQSEYKRRTFTPYDCAFRGTTPRPDLYAIPGNHDWYDSLVAFTRYFISKTQVEGFRTRQARSYFALKLPHGWWLLGLDVQLGSYIDGPQVDYFQQVATHIAAGESIIICNAEPVWIYDHLYKQDDPNMDDRNLDFVERAILKGKSVRVFLAGDLHHYRRHAADDQTQKITAGGGGAFLHPTHGADVETIQETLEDDKRTYVRNFRHKQSWPPTAKSKSLCRRNAFFPLLNPKFGVVPAVLYLLTAWSVLAPIGDLGVSDIGTVIHTTLTSLLNGPLAVFWVVTVFLGFWLFTDTHVQWYRWIAGTIHGMTHVLAIFFIGWGAAYVAVHAMGLPFRSISQLLLSGAMIVAAGYLIGPMIHGAYLLLSLNWFGRHSNEAFSSLHIEDWKNFLRLRIAADGALTIFPIGLRQVPRHWLECPDGTPGSRFVPHDPNATAPELIESPITVTHRQ
jgi:hypothetical protein